MRGVVVLAVFASLGSSCAHAACEAPQPPPQAERPARTAPPEMPACATANSCRGSEAANYNKAVAAFNESQRAFQDNGQAYVAKLNAYVAGAEAYARCELAALNALPPAPAKR